MAKRPQGDAPAPIYPVGRARNPAWMASRLPNYQHGHRHSNQTQFGGRADVNLRNLDTPASQTPTTSATAAPHTVAPTAASAQTLRKSCATSSTPTTAASTQPRKPARRSHHAAQATPSTPTVAAPTQLETPTCRLRQTPQTEIPGGWQWTPCLDGNTNTDSATEIPTLSRKRRASDLIETETIGYTEADQTTSSLFYTATLNTIKFMYQVSIGAWRISKDAWSYVSSEAHIRPVTVNRHDSARKKRLVDANDRERTKAAVKKRKKSSKLTKASSKLRATSDTSFTIESSHPTLFKRRLDADAESNSAYTSEDSPPKRAHTGIRSDAAMTPYVGAFPEQKKASTSNKDQDENDSLNFSLSDSVARASETPTLASRGRAVSPGTFSSSLIASPSPSSFNLPISTLDAQVRLSSTTTPVIDVTHSTSPQHDFSRTDVSPLRRFAAMQSSVANHRPSLSDKDHTVPRKGIYFNSPSKLQQFAIKSHRMKSNATNVAQKAHKASEMFATTYHNRLTTRDDCVDVNTQLAKQKATTKAQQSQTVPAYTPQTVAAEVQQSHAFPSYTPQITEAQVSQTQVTAAQATQPQIVQQAAAEYHTPVAYNYGPTISEELGILPDASPPAPSLAVPLFAGPPSTPVVSFPTGLSPAVPLYSATSPVLQSPYNNDLSELLDATPPKTVRFTTGNSYKTFFKDDKTTDIMDTALETIASSPDTVLSAEKQVVIPAQQSGEGHISIANAGFQVNQTATIPAQQSEKGNIFTPIMSSSPLSPATGPSTTPSCRTVLQPPNIRHRDSVAKAALANASAGIPYTSDLHDYDGAEAKSEDLTPNPPAPEAAAPAPARKMAQPKSRKTLTSVPLSSTSTSTPNPTITSETPRALSPTPTPAITSSDVDVEGEDTPFSSGSTLDSDREEDKSQVELTPSKELVVDLSVKSLEYKAQTLRLHDIEEEEEPAPPDPVAPLMAPLTEEEEAKLKAAAGKCNNGLNKEAGVAGRLTAHDFGTLLPSRFAGAANAWLNDEIVNGYLAMLVGQQQKAAGWRKQAGGAAPPVHAFASHFFTTVKRDVKAVTRWASKAQLSGVKYLDADLIFYPICHGSHWRLLAVKPKERVIEYLDSLGGSGSEWVGEIRKYLAVELGNLYHEKEWQEVWGGSTEQVNNRDCGVFTLLNALVLLRGEPTTRVVASNGMKEARERIAISLLAGSPTTEL